MERTIDGNDISLSEHLLEGFDSAATNFLRGLGGEFLVVKVEEFLAVEGYETSQDTFADTSDTDGGNDFALEIEGVLCHLGDVPVTSCDLFVGGNKVADESEDGEDDVFSDGDDVGSSDFSNEKFLLVGSSQIDMVGSFELELP
jgi:hypothetical protein